MVNLFEKPYNLTQEDVDWVESTIASMTDEEKVGQLFFQLTANPNEDYLKELMDKYHLGGCRYNSMPGKIVMEHNRCLQKNAKVPIFIACNTEAGGNGSCSDGTFIGANIKIGASRNAQYAYELGRIANEQAASLGCNMAFAPVCDIHYNWQNTEIVSRSFGNDPDRVAEMGLAYMNGLHTVPGFASVAKHFPGNGVDFRDAHLSNNVNDFDEATWMETYGKVYKTLIDAGLEGVMGGHIMMPNYVRGVNPGVADEEMLPATLCPEIMNGLLREKLGFNGFVVTDASHMVGMTNRMKRKDMLPACINAGCDMFLFFNDPDEDYTTMLEAYKNGIITEERMTEALTRIIGMKAHLGLHKKSKEELVPEQNTLTSLKREDGDAIAKAISSDSLTLVKYKDEGVLPITPEKYKKIMIVNITGVTTGNRRLAETAAKGGPVRKTPAEKLRDKLIQKGFDVFLYESPIDKVEKELAQGKTVDVNIYFAGKHPIQEFVKEQDLVISLFDVTGRPIYGPTKGSSEIPWYVFELPVVGVSVGAPTMLADAPMLRTYINAYDSRDCTLDALVDALISGPEAFRGEDPIDSYCGMWDTRI